MHIDKTLEVYRSQTFGLEAGNSLQTPAQAVEFVNARGFVLFWPIKGIDYPNLWTAVAGERPVASQHDDPGHITWGWKDNLLDQRQWYYAKIIRGKATMIALPMAAHFYALSENYGDPENDYLEQYFDGKLSQPAKNVYEALLDEGPLDTIQLKQKIHMSSRSSKSVFDRTLVELQRDFKILPTGISDSGAWRYSFIYDLVHRYYPEIPGQARKISAQEARLALARQYFENIGRASGRDVRKFFSWTSREVERTLARLEENEELKITQDEGDRLRNIYTIPALSSP